MRPEIVRFEGFEYRRQEQCLFRSGERLAIGSRALALLDALLSRPGVYLSAAELMRSAWPDTHVDESNLRVQISSLRHQLGPDGRVIIRNAPGRGYAFGGHIDVIAYQPPMTEWRAAPSRRALRPSSWHRPGSRCAQY